MDFSDLDQKHYLHNANLQALLNEIANGATVGKLMDNPTLAIGSSSKAKIKTSAFAYVKDGVMKTIAAAETAFTATSHDLADGGEAVYLLSLKLADDSLVITKGTEVVSADEDAVAPATPDGHLKLGEVLIATSGAIFDASSTDLDAATLDVTYTNKTDYFSGLA